jgi:hypothetical protein
MNINIINNINNNMNIINNINNNINIIDNNIIHHQSQRFSFYVKYNILMDILEDMIDIVNINDLDKYSFLVFLNTSLNLLIQNRVNRDNMSLDKIAYALTYICGTLKKYMYTFNMQKEYANYGLLNMFKYI